MSLHLSLCVKRQQSVSCQYLNLRLLSHSINCERANSSAAGSGIHVNISAALAWLLLQT